MCMVGVKDTDVGECSSSHPSLCSPLNRRLCGPQSRSCPFGEQIILLTLSDKWSVDCILSHVIGCSSDMECVCIN